MTREKATREKILKGALTVIAADGVDAITHRRVAAQAGVSNGVVSYYYKTRDALLHAAFHHLLEDAEAIAAELRGRDDPQGPAELIDLLVEVLDLGRRDVSVIPAEYELMLYARRSPQLAQMFADWEFRAQAELGEVLEGLGCDKPLLGAKVVIGQLRAFELDLLTNPALGPAALRQRLEMIVPPLCGVRRP